MLEDQVREWQYQDWLEMGIFNCVDPIEDEYIWERLFGGIEEDPYMWVYTGEYCVWPRVNEMIIVSTETDPKTGMITYITKFRPIDTRVRSAAWESITELVQDNRILATMLTGSICGYPKEQ